MTQIHLKPEDEPYLKRAKEKFLEQGELSLKTQPQLLLNKTYKKSVTGRKLVMYLLNKYINGIL